MSTTVGKALIQRLSAKSSQHRLSFVTVGTPIKSVEPHYLKVDNINVWYLSADGGWPGDEEVGALVREALSTIGGEGNLSFVDTMEYLFISDFNLEESIIEELTEYLNE